MEKFDKKMTNKLAIELCTKLSCSRTVLKYQLLQLSIKINTLDIVGICNFIPLFNPRARVSWAVKNWSSSLSSLPSLSTIFSNSGQCPVIEWPDDRNQGLKNKKIMAWKYQHQKNICSLCPLFILSFYGHRKVLYFFRGHVDVHAIPVTNIRVLIRVQMSTIFD